jgi:hypothetical protein
MNTPVSPDGLTGMKLKLISCEVLYREFCHAVARSPHQIDVEFLPKGLHDIGCVGMLQRLQDAIDRVDTTRYEAILLGYGLCNNGIAGLRAPAIPLVVPRAHDCMTMFFGSKERYLSYFQENPGTYFLTTGWLERGEATGELRQLSIQSQSGMDMTYEQLVEKYGEENAKFLYETLGNQTKHYRQMTFIAMGIEPNDSFAQAARERAAEHSLQFQQVQGSLRLVENLVTGRWDEEDFLVLRPGEKIVVNMDTSIIAAERTGE